MVLAPSENSPEDRPTTAARMIPCGSIPLWVSKRESSMAMKAFCKSSGISSSEVNTRLAPEDTSVSS